MADLYNVDYQICLKNAGRVVRGRVCVCVPALLILILLGPYRTLHFSWEAS